MRKFDLGCHLTYAAVPVGEFFVLLVQLPVTNARLAKHGGARAIMAENLLFKQQLLVACRTRQRAFRPSTLDRLLFAWWKLFKIRFLLTA